MTFLLRQIFPSATFEDQKVVNLLTSAQIERKIYGSKRKPRLRTRNHTDIGDFIGPWHTSELNMAEGEVEKLNAEDQEQHAFDHGINCSSAHETQRAVQQQLI